MAVGMGMLPVWLSFGSGTSFFIAMAIAFVVPAGIMLSFNRKGSKVKDETQQQDGSMSAVKPSQMNREPTEQDEKIDKELWCPKLDRVDWKEWSTIPGCPWSFEGCEEIGEAMDRIWRAPLSTKEMQNAFDALKPRVKGVQVARIKLPLTKEVHHVVIYTLLTGAELFGGAPLEHAVGLELGMNAYTQDDEVPSGLRRRGQKEPTANSTSGGLEQMVLPCLAPFYRIHDGFGVLLSIKHLSVLVASPNDSVHGSCFYVYPARGVESMTRLSHLMKFARVDRNCIACADIRKEVPKVVYVERKGEQIEDDESLLDFVADTVSNVAGVRVVPPSYMEGEIPNFKNM